MGEKIKLNNGAEISGHLIDMGDSLFLYLSGITMERAFALLIEPENTKIIRWERFGETGTVKGYKHLYSISEEATGVLTAGLKKN